MICSAENNLWPLLDNLGLCDRGSPSRRLCDCAPHSSSILALFLSMLIGFQVHAFFFLLCYEAVEFQLGHFLFCSENTLCHKLKLCCVVMTGRLLTAGHGWIYGSYIRSRNFDISEWLSLHTGVFLSRAERAVSEYLFVLEQQQLGNNSNIHIM